MSATAAARDEHGWVRGVRWALGKGGGFCANPEHAGTDYLGPNPVYGRVSQTEREGRKLPKEVRTCGVCSPKERPPSGSDGDKRRRTHSQRAEWSH